jgi:hypothetical protein
MLAVNGQVRTSIGRWTIMGIVSLAAVSSYLLLWYVGRGGAVSEAVRNPAMRSLVSIYLPLIAIMGAFYFGEEVGDGCIDRVTSRESYFFSLFVISLWTLAPPLFIFFSETVEMAFRAIDTVGAFGQTAAAGAVAFYFAKSKKQ